MRAFVVFLLFFMIYGGKHRKKVLIFFSILCIKTINEIFTLYLCLKDRKQVCPVFFMYASVCCVLLNLGISLQKKMKYHQKSIKMKFKVVLTLEQS